MQLVLLFHDLSSAIVVFMQLKTASAVSEGFLWELVQDGGACERLKAL